VKRSSDNDLGRSVPVTIDPVAHARRWKTLGVLSLSLLIIGLDNTILNVALPSLQEEFNASSSTLQWIVDSYLLVFAGLLLTMGTLGDRFGRKLALQAGIAIFGCASLAVLVADSANQLIAVRAVMGIGGALIMPATLSIITNIFPREERGKAIGIWAGMASVGIGLGPLCGGLLLEYFDWTSVFLVNVPVAVVAFVGGLLLVSESRDPEPGAFDFPGALLSVGALCSLVYGVIEAPNEGWTDPVILGCFAVASALAAAFIRWELRTAHPMLNLTPGRLRLLGAGGRRGYDPAGAGARTRLGLEHQAGRAVRNDQGRHGRLGRPRQHAPGRTGVVAGHGLLAHRPLVLRGRPAHRLDHGPGDRISHGRRP
jgi:MFS family permease